MILDESQDFTGIEAISIVTHPAIESEGVLLEKQNEVLLAKEVKRGVFIAPILKPTKLIYREDDNGGYYIHFSKDTIRLCAEKYMKEMRVWQSTEQHEDNVDGVCLIESWIVEDVEKDKSAIYNLNVNVGTWCGMFKIDNKDVREKLESGELRGISIEGYFADKVQMTGVRFINELANAIK